MRYYKAVRPDGTDFYSGTVDYAAGLASGEPVLHPSAEKVGHGASTYLSVATVPTDCTGFSWPCRLFEVEPIGRAYRDDTFSNKRRVRAVRVLAELPAHEVFGSQGEQVVALIDRAHTLTPDQMRRLSVAWYAARDAEWGAAMDAAIDAARDAAMDAAMDAAHQDAALYAAMDAACALVVRDLITPEQFDLLAGPWVSVMGPIEGGQR